MAYRVLVVDDSGFFQVRLKQIIDEHPDLAVCGVAANGREAIELDDELKPDVISMDYEMPFMDGVTAVRAILAKRKVPIVMFSSMTYEGARITLDALEAGAVDFIPKNFTDVSRSSANLKKKLHDTLLMFARNARHGSATLESVARASGNWTAPAVNHSALAPLRDHRKADLNAPRSKVRKFVKGRIKLAIIGTSTGGPVALSEVLQRLPNTLSVPLVVIQHMPENFTKALAERLNKQCAISVAEAKDGDTLQAGKVLIAPGGHQLIFDRRGAVKIMPGDDRVNYKPSVDVAFASAANVYGAGVLGVVLTGMGADGCEGARLLKEKNAFIWGQDQASCVVYGMPKAVAIAGLTDEVLPLSEIGSRLAQDL